MENPRAATRRTAIDTLTEEAWLRFFPAGRPRLDLTPREGTISSQEIRKALPVFITQLADALESTAPRAADAPEPRPKGTATLGDSGRTEALLGLILLWNDRFAEAHAAAQSREGTADCDLVHAFFHRREGDFANSLYWFRSAGNHPCFQELDFDRIALKSRKPFRAGLQTHFPSLARLTYWRPEELTAAISKTLRRRGQGGPRNAEALETLEILEGCQEMEYYALFLWLAKKLN